MNDLKLVFVNKSCVNDDGTVEYDLFFSETPEIVWGRDWDYNNPSICGDITPENDTYSEKIRIKVSKPLKTLQETSCYSMEYATYGMVALSWIDIDKLETYPEEGRFVLRFGDPKNDVLDKILTQNIEILGENS